jgi:predicted amidohydrolase
MANKIMVSTIGALPLMVDSNLSDQAIVEQMLEYWQNKLAQVLPDKPDLIVLPECCDRPKEFNRQSGRLNAYYQARGRQMLDFFAEIARQHSCYIAYSAKWDEGDGTFRNSTHVLDRRGRVAGRYNKNHLVIEENIEGGTLYGKAAPLIKCDFGQVACVICFDLNFDELRLKYAAARPDLILFSSMYHGGLMQAYWAYSCRAHFAAAIAASVPSAIISPVGMTLAATTNYADFITAEINLDCCVVHLDYNGEKLMALKKKYGRDVTITNPGFLGSVLITSETKHCRALDMAHEFQIELLDDYFVRALAHRHVSGHIEP